MTQTPSAEDPGERTAIHPVPDQATLEAVDRWIGYRLWHTRTPGAQVAIGLAGQPFFSRAYGWADLGAAVPMRTDSLFRIASHSKTFTATLVLQLVEQSRLGLDDPVGAHLPALAGASTMAAISVRELLEHTGGVLRDGRDADYWAFQRDFPDQDALLALIVDGGAKAAPGETFAYSNLGYSLLGLVVEAVTGTTFHTAVTRGILDPLDLADTAVAYVPSRAGDYAAGHSGLATDVCRRVLPHIDTRAMDAATGFTSTAEDLVAYFGAHTLGDERLLSDRTKRLQQRRANGSHPHKPDAPGYGWGLIVEEIDGQRFVGHSGGYPGHITKTLLDPVTGLVISVLTNAIDGPAAPLARGVAQLLAESRRTVPKRLPLSEPTLRRTGRYAGDWGVVDIAALGGRLLALDPTSWSPLESVDELHEDGERLRIAGGSGFGSVGEPVTFAPDAAPGGQPHQIRYGGMTMRAFAQLPVPADHPGG